MASMEKYPSGLNKWIESDKPAMQDFVGDNRIHDENAMWKETYDEDGAVADTGGIKEYAMAKDTYGAPCFRKSYAVRYSGTTMSKIWGIEI